MSITLPFLHSLNFPKVIQLHVLSGVLLNSWLIVLLVTLLLLIEAGALLVKPKIIQVYLDKRTFKFRKLNLLFIYLIFGVQRMIDVTSIIVINITLLRIINVLIQHFIFLFSSLPALCPFSNLPNPTSCCWLVHLGQSVIRILNLWQNILFVLKGEIRLIGIFQCVNFNIDQGTIYCIFNCEELRRLVLSCLLSTWIPARFH